MNHISGIRENISWAVSEGFHRLGDQSRRVVLLISRLLRREENQLPPLLLEREDSRLGIDLFQHIYSFLPNGDPAWLGLARVSRVIAAAFYFSRQAPLNLQIGQLLNRQTTEPLPDGSVDPDSQRCLVNILTSPIAEYPVYWLPVMDRFMIHFFGGERQMGNLQKHAEIARLLEASEVPISLAEKYRFFQYLTKKILNSCSPWESYRILEKYMEQPTLREVSQKALKAHLSRRANQYLEVRQEQTRFSYSENLFIRYQQVDIDPRFWFGNDLDTRSLWYSADRQNRLHLVIPDLLVEVLCSRIRALRTVSNRGLPFVVEIDNRTGARMPYGFISPLTSRLAGISDEIFVRSNADGLEHRFWPEIASFVVQRYPSVISRIQVDPTSQD